MKIDDPDRQFVQGFPITKSALRRQFVKTFLGLSWLFVFFFYLRYGYKTLGWGTLIVSYLPGIAIHWPLVDGDSLLADTRSRHSSILYAHTGDYRACRFSCDR